MLSNNCVDAFSNYLIEQGYFQEVMNYCDSLNYLLNDTISLNNRIKMLDSEKSDINIYLDFLHFNTSFIPSDQTPFFSRVDLLWTIKCKNDTMSYGYHQTDTLCFDQNQLNAFSYSNYIPKQLLNNSCEYLGEFFGKKIIPTWYQVDRLYYKSHNTDMLKAEKHAQQNDWLKAAEIWNRETKNKNQRIAAKAMYNLALACEMEGKPDLAIAWLIKSYSGLKKKEEEHKANCQRYINVLALRKLEIKKLGTQIR
jgi:hypothetical protein